MRLKRLSVSFLGVGLAIAMLSASSLSWASSWGGQNDRKGFFLGFGIGGGGIHLKGLNKGAGLFNLRIGGGITDDILLMYEGTSSYTRDNGVDIVVTNSTVAAQFYLVDNFYIRPGIGVSFGVTLSSNSKASIGADLTVGYEFRIGRYFAVGPELTYQYSRIRTSSALGINTNSHTYGAQAALQWYF